MYHIEPDTSLVRVVIRLEEVRKVPPYIETRQRPVKAPRPERSPVMVTMESTKRLHRILDDAGMVLTQNIWATVGQNGEKPRIMFELRREPKKCGKPHHRRLLIKLLQDTHEVTLYNDFEGLLFYLKPKSLVEAESQLEPP